MKKSLLVGMIALAGLLTFAGCGNNDAASNTGDNQTNTSSSTESGEVKLADIATINPDEYIASMGDYNNLEIEAELAKITDADVDSLINQVIQSSGSNQNVEGRALQSGDIANINYAGKMNGEAFEGGTDDSEAGYDLTIGSNSFIPGFEDALIGMEVGETRDIDLTFPDEYYEELAGKPVTFTVTLNAIKETVYPELTDEFAVEQGIDGVSTVDELKAFAKNILEENAQSSYETTVSNAIMNKLIEITEFKDEMPQDRYDYYYNDLYNSDEALATDYGLQLEGFVMAYYGYASLDDYINQVKDYADKSVKFDLVVAKILQAENQMITDEDVEKEIEARYEEYGCESPEDFKEQFEVDQFKAYLMTNKVIELVKEKATVVAPK